MKFVSAVLIGVMTAAAGQQRFRSGAEAVAVDVLVTRGGRPVGGLTVSDFELRDSGVRQQIQSAVLEDVPLNVLLALDTSGSMAGPPLQHLKAAAVATLPLLAARDQVALVCFNEGIQVWVPWTSDLQAMKIRIAAVQPSGGTALYDAAFTALTLQNRRPGTRNLVLLFTDGEDTVGWLPGQNVISAAGSTETVLYAVGLRRPALAKSPGYRVDFRSGLQPPVPHMTAEALAESFVENLSIATGGKYLAVENGEHLGAAFVEILTEFRSRYLLTYVPAGVPAMGWHPLDVKLTRSVGTVRARRGYLRAPTHPEAP